MAAAAVAATASARQGCRDRPIQTIRKCLSTAGPARLAGGGAICCIDHASSAHPHAGEDKTGASAAPSSACRPTESRSHSQANAGSALVGSWTLILDCPAALHRQLPPISVTVPGPNFSTRFGGDGQAFGRIVDGRLALRLSFTTDIGERIKAELVLNKRDGAFRGGGLLTGFAAGSYGGADGQGDRQCTATMAR